MTTTATHLRTCALHWTDLHEAAGTPAQIGAFGLGLRGYLARLDAADAEQIEYERHQAAHLRTLERDPIQLGTRPVPVRLHILDTMRTVEAALIACAADRHRRAQLAHADLVDPRRWRYTGRRTAPYAALWLLARVERKPGPCRRLTPEEEQRIGTVAAGAAARIERALDIAAQQRALAEPCPLCGGTVDVHGGEGRPPLAHCTGCGKVWSEQGAAA